MLWLAATPIGNLGDASPRLREALATADLVVAEDTRQTAQLFRLLGIDRRTEFVSLHEHNERQRAAAVVARAAQEEVVLVSDAGMPTVSDPGFRVVQLAAEQGVSVSVIPGPSAVTTALALSALPTDRFTFEGFVPRKSGERLRAFRQLAAEPRTMVFFDSPSRIAQTLLAAATVFGECRQAAVCRELTKLHEEVQRGSLAELATWAEQGVRGEVVLVVAGAAAPRQDPHAAMAELRRRVAGGERLKDASKAVAAAYGLRAGELYAAWLAEGASHTAGDTRYTAAAGGAGTGSAAAKRHHERGRDG